MAFTKLLLLFLVASLSFTVQAGETEGDYEYWYVILNDGGVRIEIFNPARETTEIFHGFALVSDKASVSNVMLSANQEWLAYVTGNGSYHNVYIVNLQTRTHQLVMENILRDDDDYGIGDAEPFIEWSPVAPILLVRAYEVDSYPNIVNYLFDAESSVTARRFDSVDEFGYGQIERVDWADDGRLFALKNICSHQGLGCETRPSIWDAVTLDELAEFGENFLYYTYSSCDFSWTSDEAYIAYIDTCNGSFVESENEVYLYNNNEDELIALTHFTAGTSLPNLYRATYSLFWLDNQHLLIGANYNDASGEYNQTLLYTINSQTLETIDNVSGEDWTYSPNRQYIAYRSRLGFFPEYFSTMRILDAASLTTIREEEVFPCNFRWSEDSQWLAYSEQPVNSRYGCSQFASQIKLLNLETSELHHINVQDGARMLPLAWVQIQDQ